MARGNDKSQAALKVEVPAEVKPEVKKDETPESSIDNPRPVKELASNLVKYLKGIYDSAPGDANAKRIFVESQDPIRSLAIQIQEYERWSHFKEYGHKQRKQAIVDAVNALPKDFRDYIKVPNSKINELKRVSNHASNPDEKGNISASFTTNDRYLEWGAKNLVGNDAGSANNPASLLKHGSEMKIYTAKDIQSFDGIISFDRFKKLLVEVITAGNSEATTRYQSDGFRETDWNRIGRLATRYPYNANMAAADEHLVYGIKWKDGVK